MDSLGNLTGHQDFGRATKGSSLQNFRVLQGGLEILPASPARFRGGVDAFFKSLFPLRP